MNCLAAERAAERRNLRSTGEWGTSTVEVISTAAELRKRIQDGMVGDCAAALIHTSLPPDEVDGVLVDNFPDLHFYPIVTELDTDVWQVTEVLVAPISINQRILEHLALCYMEAKDAGCSTQMEQLLNTVARSALSVFGDQDQQSTFFGAAE